MRGGDIGLSVLDSLSSRSAFLTELIGLSLDAASHCAGRPSSSFRTRPPPRFFSTGTVKIRLAMPAKLRK